MSDLSKDNLRMICKLSKLRLSDDELDKLFTDLKKVADYIDLLSEVDVSDLQPYMHAEEVGFGNLREDEVQGVMPREVFLNNAPEQVGGMIRVPPVMK